MAEKHKVNKKITGIALVASCTIILFFSMWLHLPQHIAYDEYGPFDPASNNMMTTDLLYMRHYGLDSPLIKYLYPLQTLNDGTVIPNAAAVGEYFLLDEAPPADDFALYSSNLCVHRYFYGFIYKFFGPSPQMLQSILQGIGTLLLALALTGILAWIRHLAGWLGAVVSFFTLAFASPLVTQYSSNLYWAGFSLFLPILASVWVVRKKPFMQAKNWNYLAFVIALVTCLFKQLLYFEFISSVMIAMMIPYLYEQLLRGINGRKVAALKELLWPATGALCSFGLAIIAKLAVLWAWSGNLHTAWQATISNILVRTHGASASAETALQGAETSLAKVLNDMLGTNLIQLRTALSIPMYALVLALFVTSLLMYVLVRKGKLLHSQSVGALLICAWIAFLAPLSWFILAQGHTAVHMNQCAALWYLPFVPLAVAGIVTAVWYMSISKWRTTNWVIG